MGANRGVGVGLAVAVAVTVAVAVGVASVAVAVGVGDGLAQGGISYSLRDVPAAGSPDRIAEVLRKEPCATVSLNASYPHLGESRLARVEITVDHFELQVRIALIQIYLEVAPFGVVALSIASRGPCATRCGRSAIRRAALDRGEDSTARAVVSAAITRRIIGALVCPQWEDGEVVRPYIRRRRQTGADVAARFVDRHEIKPSIGIDVHTVIGLIIQLERERQWRPRYRRHRCGYRCRSSPERS